MTESGRTLDRVPIARIASVSALSVTMSRRLDPKFWNKMMMIVSSWPQPVRSNSRDPLDAQSKRKKDSRGHQKGKISRAVQLYACPPRTHCCSAFLASTSFLSFRARISDPALMPSCRGAAREGAGSGMPRTEL